MFLISPMNCYFCLDDMSQLYSYKKYEREIDSIISQLVASRLFAIQLWKHLQFPSNSKGTS